MNKDELMNRINEWFDNDEHEKIIEAILALPDSSLDDEILGQLAVAYNNTGEYKKAIAVLESQRERLDGNFKWHYRMGYALMNASEDEECENDESLRFNILDRARICFARCMNMNPPEEYLEECDEYIEEIEDILGEGEDEEEIPEDYDPELYDEEELNAVEEHIKQYFGEFPSVYHEIASPDIHVDICCVPPSEKRNFYTLITLGMGAHIMNVPEELGAEEYGRAELLICLPPDWKLGETSDEWYWPLALIKNLARLPINCDTWLGWGHSVDNQEPFADNTELCGSLLINPVGVDEGGSICELPSGEKVNFFEILPLYRGEMNFKIDHDAQTLLGRMGNISHVTDISRENTCEGYIPRGNDDPFSAPVDDMESHSAKIRGKKLPLDEICGANHIAIFMRWAIERGLCAPELCDCFPETVSGVLDGTLRDLRGFLRDELGGVLTPFFFNYEGYSFAYEYYIFSEDKCYPSDVDDYAERYFGTEKYNSEEFADEAYLFVPFDESYYNGLSAVIESRFCEFRKKFDANNEERLSGFAENVMRGLLGCGCKCFYPRGSSVREAMENARRGGEREGFTPLLMIYDDEPINTHDDELRELVSSIDPVRPLTIAEVPVKSASEAADWFRNWFGAAIDGEIAADCSRFTAEYGEKPAVIRCGGEAPVLYLPQENGTFLQMTADPRLNESGEEGTRLVLDKDNESDHLLPALVNYIGCRYRLFPEAEDDVELMIAYREALLRGKIEGFVPVIMTIDKDLLARLIENSGCRDEESGFGFSAQKLAEYRKGLSDMPLPDGEGLLRGLSQEISVPERTQPEAPLKRFISYWSFERRKTVPLLLVEVPIKEPWEVFAHIPFGEYDGCPDALSLMAAAKWLYGRFGAVPAVIGDGTLEFYVERPADKSAAGELAAMMFGICPLLKKSAPIEKLADSLNGSTVWVFRWK